MKKLLAIVLLFMTFSVSAELFTFTINSDLTTTQCKSTTSLTFDNIVGVTSDIYKTKCVKMVHMQMGPIEYAMVECSDKALVMLTNSKQHCELVNGMHSESKYIRLD